MSVSKLVCKLVSDNFEGVDYPIKDSDRLSMVKENLHAVDVSSLIDMAIEGEIKKQKRLRALESAPKQDVLWCDELLGVLITFKTIEGEPASVKYGAATADHHEQSRANEIGHLQKAWKAFERQEERRKIIMPILHENPGMTTREALQKLGILGGDSSIAA